MKIRELAAKILRTLDRDEPFDREQLRELCERVCGGDNTPEELRWWRAARYALINREKYPLAASILPRAYVDAKYGREVSSLAPKALALMERLAALESVVR